MTTNVDIILAQWEIFQFLSNTLLIKIIRNNSKWHAWNGELHLKVLDTQSSMQDLKRSKKNNFSKLQYRYKDVWFLWMGTMNGKNTSLAAWTNQAKFHIIFLIKISRKCYVWLLFTWKKKFHSQKTQIIFNIMWY